MERAAPQAVQRLRAKSFKLDTTEADEQAAIDTGQIQATGIRYVGRLR